MNLLLRSQTLRVFETLKVYPRQVVSRRSGSEADLRLRSCLSCVDTLREVAQLCHKKPRRGKSGQSVGQSAGLPVCARDAIQRIAVQGSLPRFKLIEPRPDESPRVRKLGLGGAAQPVEMR